MFRKELLGITRLSIGYINVTGLGVVDNVLLHDFDFCNPLLFGFYICGERPIPRSSSSFIEAFPDRYDTYIEQGGTNVSGGQKQRLCIARALLKKPAILVLDDSTSAVDTKTDALIRKAFREEIPDTTKIIIAQRISSVQDADAILVLDDGRISGYGTHEQLLASNEIYHDIYISQTKGDNGHDEA